MTIVATNDVQQAGTAIAKEKIHEAETGIIGRIGKMQNVPQGIDAAVAKTLVAATIDVARVAVIKNVTHRTIVLLAKAMRRRQQATAAFTQWVRTIGRTAPRTPPIKASSSSPTNLRSTRVIFNMMTDINSEAAAAAGAAAAARAQVAAAAEAAAAAGAAVAAATIAKVRVTATRLMDTPISTMTLLTARTV